MSLTKTKITCSCGASIESAFTSEVTAFMGRHDQCLLNHITGRVVASTTYTDGSTEITVEAPQPSPQVTELLLSVGYFLKLWDEDALYSKYAAALQQVRRAYEAAKGSTC